MYAWAEKNQSTIGAIHVQEKIILNRNCLITRSIGSFREVQNALSWNEAIQTLIESGEIIPMKKDKLSCAIIDFKIYVQYNYNPLEVAVNMQFTYRVHVPGYVNKSEPHPCYSSDTSLPRKVFHFEDYNNNHSESVHPKNYSDENENIGIHFNNCSSVAHNEEESVTSNSNVINNDEYPEDNFEKTREIVEYNMDDDNSTLYPHSFVNQVLDNTSLAGWVP